MTKNNNMKSVKLIAIFILVFAFIAAVYAFATIFALVIKIAVITVIVIVAFWLYLRITRNIRRSTKA